MTNSHPDAPATGSASIRLAVSRGDLAPADAVRLLSDAGMHGGRRDCAVSCPECGAAFHRSDTGRVNTCSDPCQRRWNQAMLDLDEGRTIVLVSELTAQRAADLLGTAGLAMLGLGAPGAGRVVSS